MTSGRFKQTTGLTKSEAIVKAQQVLKNATNFRFEYKEQTNDLDFYALVWETSDAGTCCKACRCGDGFINVALMHMIGII